MRSYLKRNSWVLDIKYGRHVLNVFQAAVILNARFNFEYFLILLFVHGYFRACMSMSHRCAWCPRSSGEGIRFPGTGITDYTQSTSQICPTESFNPEVHRTHWCHLLSNGWARRLSCFFTRHDLGLTTSFSLSAGHRCPGKSCREALPAFTHCGLGLGLSLLSSLIFDISLQTDQRCPQSCLRATRLPNAR